MGLNFITGYYKEGMLVRDIRLAAIRYMSTFFLLDMFINVVDLVTAVLEFRTEDTSTGTMTLRAVRIAKLSRLARIIVVFNHLHERMKSWDLDSSSFTLVGLGARLIAILFLLNHLICCGWFWIGSLDLPDDTDQHWLDVSITSGGLKYRDASPTFQYLTSLHWAFTQMTPGSMSVVPQNSVERVWNVFCLVIGLFVSALLISQLSAKMVRVQSMNSAQLQQMELLGRFLVEQDVPRALSQRIRRHVQEKSSVKKPLTIGDLPSLELLPLTVRQELCCSVFARTLLSHSVFYTWCVSDYSVIDGLAFQACEVESYARNDDVFVPHQSAKKVFCLRKGEMRYRREIFTTNGISEFPEITIEPKEWMSTIAMFCNWNYVGRLMACETCDAISVHVQRMLEVMAKSPQIFTLSQSYATTYSFLANSSDAEYASRVDLDVSPARILLAMPLGERLNFTCPLLVSLADKQCGKFMDRHFNLKRQNISLAAQENLMDELEKGKCVVCLGTDWQLLRTVCLCVLEITNSTGKLLVQVATWKNGEYIPAVALPGTKLREKETSKEAAKRLIKDDLPDLGGSMHFETTISKEQHDVSKKFGVRSLYLKTTFCVRHMTEQETAELMPRPTTRTTAARPTAARTTAARTSMVPWRRAPSTFAAPESSIMGASESNMFSGMTAIEGCRGKDKLELFAWVRRDEFQQLSRPSHEAGLMDWLSMIPGPLQKSSHSQVSLAI